MSCKINSVDVLQKIEKEITQLVGDLDFVYKDGVLKSPKIKSDLLIKAFDSIEGLNEKYNSDVYGDMITITGDSIEIQVDSQFLEDLNKNKQELENDRYVGDLIMSLTEEPIVKPLHTRDAPVEDLSSEFDFSVREDKMVVDGPVYPDTHTIEEFQSPELRTLIGQASDLKNMTQEERNSEVNKRYLSIVNKVNKVIDASRDIKLLQNDSGYKSISTGTLYSRVTASISDFKKDETNRAILDASTKHGNRFDNYIRNYFNNSLDPNADYAKNLTSNARDKATFDYKLNELKEFFKSRQEIVIPMDITLHNEADKMAGTVDLLTVDSNGNFRVYDIKTMRNDHFTPDEYGTTKYDSTLVFEPYGKLDEEGNILFRPNRRLTQDSKRMKHQKQLSLYSMNLERTYGIKTVELGIIPIEITYEPTDQSVSSINMNPRLANTIDDRPYIPMERLANVNGITVDSEITNPDNIEYPLAPNVAELIKWKNDQVKNIKAQISALKGRMKVSTNVSLGRELSEERVRLERLLNKEMDQLEQLKERGAEVLFSGLMTELTDIEQNIDREIDVYGIVEKLNAINYFITGNNLPDAVYKLSGMSNLAHLAKGNTPIEYGNLLAKLNYVKDKYDNAGPKLFSAVAKEDAGFVRNVLDNLEGMSPKEQLEEIKKLKGQLFDTADIDVFTEFALGMDSSMGTSSAIFQMITNVYERALVKRNAEFKVYKDLTSQAYEKLAEKGDTDFNWLMKFNKAGAPLGLLIDKYNTNWYQFNRELRGLGFTKGQSRAERYASQVDHINENAIVMLPQKLKVFKDAYSQHPDYGQHFTYSDAEMESYERQLRDTIGDAMFEVEMENLAVTIKESMQLHDANRTTVMYSEKQKLLATNPFMAAEHVATSNKDVMKDGKTSTYPNLDYIRLIPKNTTVKDDQGNDTSKFYDETFTQVQDDKDKMELWRALREGYKATNSVYTPTNIEYLQIPLVPKGFNEDMSDIKGIKNKIAFGNKKGWRNIANDFFQKEVKSNFVDKKMDSTTYISDGPLSNRSDSFDRDVKRLADILALRPKDELVSLASNEGLSYSPEILNPTEEGKKPLDKKVIAKDLARKVLYETYSQKFVHNSMELFDNAAKHAARIEALPKAKILRQAYAQGTNPFDGEIHEDKAKISEDQYRKKGLSKMDNFILLEIENRTVAATNKLEKNKGKYLHDVDLMQSGAGRALRGAITKSYRVLGNKTAKKRLQNPLFSKNQMKYLTDVEKIMIDHMDIKRAQVFSEGGLSFTANDRTFRNVVDKSGKAFYFEVKGDKQVAVKEHVFYEHFEYHMADMADDLGVGMSLVGLTNGSLFITRIAKLGFQPLAGWHNRLESKLGLWALNSSGEYFPKGAVYDAQNFLAGINTYKATNLKKLTLGKEKEFDKLIYIIGNIGIEQSNLNDIDNLDNKRSSGRDGDWKDLVLNPFAPSVGYPEFKNQASVLLAVMSAQYITDNKGNQVPLFDGKGFPAHDMVNGVLRLKPEFSTDLQGNPMESNITNWEDFSIMSIRAGKEHARDNDFELFRKNVNSAIKKTQGNYDENDRIKATNSTVGKVMTFFFKWALEQTRLKWGSGGTFRLNTGETDKAGRYYDILKNQAFAGMMGFGTVAATSAAISPMLALAGLGPVMIALVYPAIRNYSTTGNFGDAFKMSLGNYETSFRLLQSTLIEFVNLPLYLANTGNRVKYFKDENDKIQYIKNNSFENMVAGKGLFGYSGKPLDRDTANNLYAFSKDISAALWFKAVIPFIISVMFYHDDDEGDSWRRKFMNFLLNNTDRLGGNISGPMNPVLFYRDMLDGVMLNQLNTLINAMSQTASGDISKATRSMSKVFLPKFLHPGVNALGDAVAGKPTKSLEHTASSIMLDDQQWNKNIQAVGWGKDAVTDGEYGAKKELKDLRQQAIWFQMDILSSQYDDEDELKKAATKAVGTKPRSMSYKEAVDKLQQDKTFR